VCARRKKKKKKKKKKSDGGKKDIQVARKKSIYIVRGLDKLDCPFFIYHLSSTFFLIYFFFPRKEQMTTQDMQPVILLSPPTTQQPRRKKSFHKLTRKLSNFSLRSAITGDIPPLPDTNELLHPNHAMQSDLLPPSPCSSSSSVYSFNVSGIATPLSPSTSTSSRKSVDRLQEKYNNYKKGAVIGSGATAKLRLLEPVSGGPVVAIKTFRKKAKDETERGYDKRMTSEFCISKTLGHQHVIKVYDLLKDRKGRWCSVMEYVCLFFFT
jgi:hypothetical protein